MSKSSATQWDKQAASFVAERKNIGKAWIAPGDKKRYNSPMIQDHMRKMQNEGARETASKTNMTKRGNPLVIIANESTPNPARRMKLLIAVKNNSKASK